MQIHIKMSLFNILYVNAYNLVYLIKIQANAYNENISKLHKRQA
jgi:hypothetical protein